MKVMMIGVAALLIGVGGGAFVGGTKVKDRILEEVAEAEHAAEAAAEAAIMDSLAVIAAGGDPVPPGPGPEADPGVRPVTGEPGPASVAGQVEDPEAAAEAEAQAAAEEEEAREAAAREEAAAVAAGLQEEGARKLAKIFGAMQAPAAADVLQQMTDAEVEMILQHLNDRIAAQILGVFDPTRAAALSRGLLSGGQR